LSVAVLVKRGNIPVVVSTGSLVIIARETHSRVPAAAPLQPWLLAVKGV
jgi:hypothetical protein